MGADADANVALRCPARGSKDGAAARYHWPPRYSTAAATVSDSASGSTRFRRAERCADSLIRISAYGWLLVTPEHERRSDTDGRKHRAPSSFAQRKSASETPTPMVFCRTL